MLKVWMGKMLKVKPLTYPFTFEEWVSHPSTKPKLKWIKKVCDEIRLEEKHGKQLKIKF
jgi:hypothetical protein